MPATKNEPRLSQEVPGPFEAGGQPCGSTGLPSVEIAIQDVPHIDCEIRVRDQVLDHRVGE